VIDLEAEHFTGDAIALQQILAVAAAEEKLGELITVAVLKTQIGQILPALDLDL